MSVHALRCVSALALQHTAIIFFKRFYLHESVMEYSPKDVASVHSARMDMSTAPVRPAHARRS